MREMINDSVLDQVTGGTVIVSDEGYVGFKTVREQYALQGIDWKSARAIAEDLKEKNPQMSDAAFDQYVKNYFIQNNYIIAGQTV